MGNKVSEWDYFWLVTERLGLHSVGAQRATSDEAAFVAAVNMLQRQRLSVNQIKAITALLQLAYDAGRKHGR